jgi:hypothetical protein
VPRMRGKPIGATMERPRGPRRRLSRVSLPGQGRVRHVAQLRRQLRPSRIAGLAICFGDFVSVPAWPCSLCARRRLGLPLELFRRPPLLPVEHLHAVLDPVCQAIVMLRSQRLHCEHGRIDRLVHSRLLQRGDAVEGQRTFRIGDWTLAISADRPAASVFADRGQETPTARVARRCGTVLLPVPSALTKLYRER